MQPSQSTTIFGAAGLAEAVQALVQAGYRCAELSRKTGRRAADKRIADDQGLRIWAIHGTLHLHAGAEDIAERRRAIRDEQDAMEELAVYAPCPYVVHYYCRNTDPDGPDVWKQTVEQLHETAKRLGFVLCVETLRARPGSFPYVCGSAEVAAFVREFGSEHLGICLDVNHVNVYEPIPLAAARSAGLIRDVHLSDNHGVAEGPLAQLRHLPPGDGVIDWPQTLHALYGAGYSGPLNMELHVEPSHDVLVRTRRWAETIRDAVQTSLRTTR